MTAETERYIRDLHDHLIRIGDMRGWMRKASWAPALPPAARRGGAGLTLASGKLGADGKGAMA